MTLGSIYRDIVSRLSSVGVSQQRLVKKDITNAINDAIRNIRVQYIQAGRGEKFATSQTVTPTSKNSDVPFLYSVALTQNIMESLPLSLTVLTSVVTVDADTIPDALDTFSEGDQKIKDDKLYEAVSDGSSVNAYNLTFVEEDVKTFYPDNGLTFYVGDVAYDLNTDTYWRCTTKYENTSDTVIGSTGNFEQLYWKQIGDAYKQADVISYERLHLLTLSSKFSQSFPISIKNKNLFALYGDIPYYVSYVPEWKEVTDLTATVDILEEMISPVKIRSLQILSSKLGVEVQLEEMQNQEDE